MNQQFPSKDDYKEQIKLIRSEINTLIPKGWTIEFLKEYYPEQWEDTSFQNKFRNFLYGKSYEAGYIRPGFMQNLKYFHQSKTQNNE